jgi:hypothetical protein
MYTLAEIRVNGEGIVYVHILDVVGKRVLRKIH